MNVQWMVDVKNAGSAGNGSGDARKIACCTDRASSREAHSSTFADATSPLGTSVICTRHMAPPIPEGGRHSCEIACITARTYSSSSDGADGADGAGGTTSLW